ncbi:DUF262 domain-containing protein [Burkholderia ubonensis]|uniref:DUF262 domain-containing protein n=1 Tax=Burkholderia ubonensis TaxID=101571 RepID=UPI0009B3BFB9|nr:DUF262 domain-containing protein [Burkholderia ubonensis]
MRLVPWDPDVQTVMSRIESGGLDLQPNFQRGEVWPKSKKQRLIDSVLREWHVPPIHVIENPQTRKQEVLDGQQRLVAIRDFVRGELSVDGSTEPLDQRIQALDGKKYRSLPEDVQRQFDQFTLRIYRIIDYKPSEPAELFYRLNQPSNLTGAEQRNAFYGPVRDQIREIVLSLEERSVGKDEFGFSNARMAYDDVICRVALTIKRGTIASKITANDLVELYRSEEPLDENAYFLVRHSLDLLVDSLNEDARPKFNKATLYTWLVFIARAVIARVFDDKSPAEMIRGFFRHFSRLGEELFQPTSVASSQRLSSLLSIYEDRATSRVADVSSIVIRDFVVWVSFVDFLNGVGYANEPLGNIRASIGQILPPDLIEPDLLARRALENGWSNLK